MNGEIRWEKPRLRADGSPERFICDDCLKQVDSLTWWTTKDWASYRVCPMCATRRYVTTWK